MKSEKEWILENLSYFFSLISPPLLLKLTGPDLELFSSGVQWRELGVSLQDFFNISPYKDHRVKLFSVAVPKISLFILYSILHSS